MKRWLEALVVLGLAALVYLFVFNRSTRLDSNKQSPSAGQPETRSANDASETVAPDTASAGSDPSPLRADAVVAASTAVTASADNPQARSPATLPVSDVPESELPRLPQDVVLENVRSAFRNFRSKYTSNPVGTNEEITRALNGENPGQTRFLRLEDGMRLNAAGELIDAWGTPYFFHQLSATEMEIHCAGPDKKMWTSDDLVIK